MRRGANMRRLFILIGVVLGVLSPTTAQHTPTLYDLIATEDDFSLFHQALEQDDTLVSVLQNPDMLFTVVVPNNRGITETLAAVDLTFEDLLQDADVLNNVLRHHIIPAVFTYTTLQDNSTSYIMTLLEERGLLIQVDGDSVFLNAVPVLGHGRRVANGQFLPVEQLLIPPQRLFTPDEAPTPQDFTLAEYIAQNPDLSLFHRMIIQFPAIQAQLEQNRPYTLFIPTDGIIRARAEALNLSVDAILEDDAFIQSLLARHILPGHLVMGTVEAILPLMRNIDFRLLSLGWTPLTFTSNDGAIYVDNARIIAADVLLTNGVIHVIDALIDAPTFSTRDA
jgi:uncharacterized surface protein with fasciclin (FAS1) repeats